MTDTAIADDASASPESVPAVEEEQKPSEQAKESEASTEKKGTAEEPTGEAEDSEKKADEEKRTKAKERLTDRLSKKSQQVREQTARAEQAERRAEAAETRLKELGESEEELVYPELKDFGYDEDAHRKALADYHQKVAERANRRNRVEDEKLAVEEAQRDLNDAVKEQWQEKQAVFAMDHDDYHQVVSSPNFVQANHVAAAVMMADNGPAVAYHLAQNPQLTDDLNRMNQAQAFLRIGALSEQLTAPKPIVQSKAPDPPDTVNPKGKVRKKTLEEMSPEEYAKERGYR